MKKLTVIVILFLLLGIYSVLAAEPEHYCHDAESWKEWENMVKKYPEDIPLQILHALRIGLCIKIEQKSISLQDATQLMNDMSEKLIQERNMDKCE